MRRIFASLIVVLVSFDCIYCNQPKNSDDLEAVENWKEITEDICKKDHSSEVQAELEKCNELDPYYKLDSFSRKCDKLKQTVGLTYYEETKADCKYHECYDKEILSEDFKKASEGVDNMKEEDKIKKSYEKYCCIRKALGLKV